MQNDFDPFILISDFGDPLEKHFAEKIKQRIPSYAKIWAEYIGNDGAANALPMQSAKQDVLDSRDEYWQRFYTLFESLAFCWNIEAELALTQKIGGIENYIRYLNLWMVFYAHLGRIHDMVEKIAGKLKRPDLVKRFEEYWKQRHIVLHGPKIPLKCINNVITVPTLGNGIRSWNDKMSWEELGRADFKQINECVTLILREIEPELDRFIAEIRKQLPSFYNWKPVNWGDFIQHQVESGTVRAGSCGWVLPSGSLLQ